MTLSEIATFAGEKIGKTDSDTATFLKKSASLNYRRVWNFAPWRETVTHSTYSVLDSTRTVTLGSNVETPLAVAYGDEELMALDLPTIISQDADLLDVDRKGTPNSFYFKGRNTGGTAELDLYPMLETSGTTSLKVVEKLKCLTRNNYVVDFPPAQADFGPGSGFLRALVAELRRTSPVMADRALLARTSLQASSLPKVTTP